MARPFAIPINLDDPDGLFLSLAQSGALTDTGTNRD
jgi:hypothetical protein